MELGVYDRQAQKIGATACEQEKLVLNISVLVVSVYWLHFLNFLVVCCVEVLKWLFMHSLNT